ncbi:MAG: Protein YceG like [Parcubacteria group bacterium]|nr:Protein YceG like [Parcubacteria group bacterium]
MNSPRLTSSLMPKPRSSRPGSARPKRKFPFVPIIICIVILGAAIFSLPLILAVDVQLANKASGTGVPFTVTVNPALKTIHTDPQVEALLATPPTQLPAAAGFLTKLFQYAALKVASLPIYQQLAAAAGAPSLFVSVSAGTRQEQVAQSFGTQLGWSAKQRTQFITESKALEPDLPQGSTVPGIYFASISDPKDVATLVHDRFDSEILSRYSSSTEAQVPLSDAMTIASLIQREAGSWDDMRMISGIIWNRLFIGMKLQVDATLQYAEASKASGTTGWWPSVEPKDKYIKSAYNTYQNAGLPPAPIANPSIAAVVAALNPKKTDCLFYFHDSHSVFHCSKTYAEHVALLKKYYGQGK